jgi:ADP-ribosyl-[dinitrogen reductase] hydrolase
MSRDLWTSLIATGGILDTDDVLRRHLEWLASSPPDIGNQTLAALREHQRGASEAAKAVFDRRGPEVSAGNGSVMYCAPLGLAYADRADDLLEAAPALSAITHWDERCKTACLAVTLTAAALVRGDDPESAVRAALDCVADREGGEELEYLTGAAGIERPIDGPDQGFTLFTAGVALRVAGEATPFEDGLREVVSLGGDTDTNASVTGALLGALHGVDALPPAWLARLVEVAAIREEADALAGLIA